VRFDQQQCRERFAAARHAHLATAGLDAVPHVVPVTFALAGDTVVTAVDHKPKTTVDLRRLRNIRANPSVALLADGYDDDWRRLWWVRADGTANVVDSPADPAHQAAVVALQDRYGAYLMQPPQGPVITIRVTRWTGWAAAT
jgi:PPOX class probable F420-dependent enzyme